MTERKSFLLYKEWGEPVNFLSDAQAGRLLKEIFAFGESGREPAFEDDAALRMISSFIFAQFHRDAEAYEAKCAANRANGKKGGRPKTQENPTKPNKTERFSEKPRKPDEEEDEGEDIYAAVAAAYNQLCPSLPRCTKLSDKRRGLIRARAREGYKLSDFEQAFRCAEASDFLSGRSGSWKANFDWILNGSNLLKVVEGSYTNPAAMNKAQREIAKESFEGI